MSFPSSHLFKWCPSLNTQTKAILISFPWILQCEMIYPFSELPQCLLGWFSECVSETTSFKNAPESVFLQRPEEALAIFPLLSQIYFATLRRISKPHIMERGRLTRLIVAGVIHWLISIIPFCSHFHTQSFDLSKCICQICNVIVDCWIRHHQTSTPVFFNHCLPVPWPSPVLRVQMLLPLSK